MVKTLTAFVENGPESLMRITGLIRRKGCTMERINMETVQENEGAYLTITLGVVAEDFENILNQMRKLHDVHEVSELTINKI